MELFDLELIEKITDVVVILAIILLIFTIRGTYKRTNLPIFHYFYLGLIIFGTVVAATTIFEIITDINLDRDIKLFKFSVVAFFLFIAYLFSGRFKGGKIKKEIKPQTQENQRKSA